MYSGAAASGGGGGGGGNYGSPGPGAPQTGWTQGNDYFGAEYASWPGYLLDFSNTPSGCCFNSNFDSLGSVLNHSNDVLVSAYPYFGRYTITSDGSGVVNRDLATNTNQTTINNWFNTGTFTNYAGSPSLQNFGRDVTIAYLNDASRTPIYVFTVNNNSAGVLLIADMNGNALNNGNYIQLTVDGVNLYTNDTTCCWDGEYLIVCSDQNAVIFHAWEPPTTHTGTWTLRGVWRKNSGSSANHYGMVYAGKDGNGSKYVISQYAATLGHERYELPPVSTWNGDESNSGTNLIANISLSYAQGSYHTAFPSNAYKPYSSWPVGSTAGNYSCFIDYYNQIFVSGGLSTADPTIYKHI